MRIFVTGGSGYLGSAIVTDLMSAGHSILALARSPDAVARLEAKGAEAFPGTLEDTSRLHEGASSCDGVIHVAFNHDLSRYAESCRVDVRAIETLGLACIGNMKPLVVTSITSALPPGMLATEGSFPVPGHSPRLSEEAAWRVADRGARVSVVRLPPTVHGEGDHAFIPALAKLAAAKGVSGYVGDGANRWPAVSRSDAATLFRLAVEAGRPPQCYHAAAEEGVAFKVIAQVIGDRLGVPTLSLSGNDVIEHFGWLTSFVSLDNPVSNALTRDLLSWNPSGPDLVTDLKVVTMP